MKTSFEVNYQKTLESILYLLSKKESVNIYNIMKSLFEADKYHLNNYGRPVTGDIYLKKQYGVLPQAAYAIFNNDLMIMNDLGLENSPIERKEGHNYKSLRPPNLAFLSASDLEALDKGANEYLHLTFTEVKNKNHKEKCWIEGIYDQPISFEQMIENPEALEYLEDIKPFTLVI